MASFPTGTSIPWLRAGVEMSLAPLALQSPVTAIYIWHAEENFVIYCEKLQRVTMEPFLDRQGWKM